MNSEKYWAKRADERERYWYRKSQETIEKELARYYASSLDEIQKDIQALYGRFAKDNQLSMTDARKLLQGQEYRKWRYSIDTYVKKINGGETGLLKELNTLAMRSRISRLDKLYSDTLMELDSLGRKTDSSMRSFLTDAYKDNYYHGMYAIGRTIGLKAPMVVVSSQSLEDVLRTRWSGKNYSERIWKNQKLLGSTLKQEMTTAIHRGESVQVISKRIANRMGVANSNATRLVRTELNYVENAAALAHFLARHPAVRRVYYPGLPTHPGHEIHRRQAKNGGAMLSFELSEGHDIARFFAALQVITLAESLGGVESLVCHPASMTHAAIPKETRDRIGITEGLIRFSVGIEEEADLQRDLAQAIAASGEVV